MACLLKAPEGSLKGCVTFTTQERDHVINPSAAIRAEVEALKRRFVVGLHHNWHDYQFHYDPLFDFSMAGEGDLIEADGSDFARIPIDACNFAPSCYSEPRNTPFWDILYVARAVAFKGIPEFFQAIRSLYDNGIAPRVLFLCALPETVEMPGIMDLRAHFESLFTPVERQRVTFLTLAWDYPFPFDTESLAFFYRNSRIFFHPAPEERRCRTAAYAWAGSMPVVANDCVASILPAPFHRPPFLFSFDTPDSTVAALTSALRHAGGQDPGWKAMAEEFSARASAQRLDRMLNEFSLRYGWGALASSPINENRLDVRLGRHLELSVGDNRIPMSLPDFCDALTALPRADIARACQTADPEMALRTAFLDASVVPAKKSWFSRT